MSKLVRDGKVAILISGGWGSGWSSDCLEEGCETNKRLALAVLGESGEDPKKVAEEEYPDAYLDGIEGLYVSWVPVGTRYIINEYDGSESLFTENCPYWKVA